MTIPEMRTAIENAKAEIARADCVAGEMASILAGRLRKSKATSTALSALKRELRDWNIHTGEWKEIAK